MGGSELRPVGILYHVIREDPPARRGCLEKKEEAQLELGRFCSASKRLHSGYCLSWRRKSVYRRVWGNRWKNVDEEEEKTDSTSL